MLDKYSQDPALAKMVSHVQSILNRVYGVGWSDGKEGKELGEMKLGAFEDEVLRAIEHYLLDK